MRMALLLIVMLALAAAGCSGDKGAAKAGGPRKGGSSVALTGKETTVAGVTFRAPGAWKDLGATGMRAASYVYGPTQGDADSATVAVFHFPQSGGTVDANFERWLGQMTMPDGTDPAQAATRQDGQVDGMAYHHIQVAGIYAAGSMGGMGDATGRKGYLLSAAVLEAPEGNVFFKLTGPEKTATEMNDGFLAMLQAARKGAH